MAENNEFESEKILYKPIESEMKDSYLSYSMSVIAGRALPDVRDGLKPVQRRILYAMYQLGLYPNKPFKKSATVVGQVIANFHPHGDSSIYFALVRLAQPFSLRYPLVLGQGNFGSVDGDAPAAMRYTEAKLSKAGLLMLSDIDKNTVDFQPNFDDSTKEPKVLPSKIPNLLLNGTSGIAVGLATNIPPHNAEEVIEGIKAYIKDKNIDVKTLMNYIKGPDFPTGGEIVNSQILLDAYTTGRAQLRVRGKWHYEEHNNRKWLVITEIPFQVNKSDLIKEIAEAAKNENLQGLYDLRDESDKEGMRIVLELKKETNTELLEAQLLKYTRLETTFGMMLTALDKGQPKTFSLKGLIEKYTAHRFEVTVRRIKYELKKAEERYHILEGLIIALNNVDEVIQDIKSSESSSKAKELLMKKYSLTEVQANAILELKLQKLAALETKQIKEEHSQLEKIIREYKEILSSEEKIYDIIIKELDEVKEILKGQRLTDLTTKVTGSFDEEKLIEEETVAVTITNKGYVKRIPLEEYRIQNRGGKGLTGTKTREEDFVEKIIIANTHDYLLLFSDKGKVYWLKTYKIPEGSRTALGRPIINLVNLEKEEKITAIIPVRKFSEENYLFFITKKGIVKRTPLNAFSNVRVTGIKAINLEENNDELIDVKLTDGNDYILLGTALGKSIYFKETDVRAMGRTAYGVRGIKLQQNDYVVGAAQKSEGTDVLTIKENGYGKKTLFEQYRVQNRGGSGVINIKTEGKKVVGVKAVTDDKGIIVITQKGIIIRTLVKNISRFGRASKGVRIIRLKEDDKVVSFSVVEQEEAEE